MKSRRPRRRIEIYFVLYLAALVLLLPEKNVPTGSDTVDLPSDLRLDLQPERVRLECILGASGDGVITLKSIDSMNTIRYVGDVQDLQFRARVEDLSTGDVIVVEPDQPNALFRIETQPNRQAVVFHWNPGQRQRLPRTMRVTLLGSGLPILNREQHSKMPAGLRVNGSTQFVLATVVENEDGSLQFAQGDSRVDTVTIIQRNIDGGTALGNFWIEMSRDSIKTVPTRYWENRVNIGGADPTKDLLAMPDVQVDRRGVTVDRRIDSAQRMIVLSGRAPASGTYTVMVQARRSDGQLAQTRFSVEALPLKDIALPDVLHPGVQYVIDPRLPDLPDAEAIITKGGQRLAAVRSGKLRYTPKSSDVGSRVYFERFADGQRLGEPVPVSIEQFPAPKIIDVLNFGNGEQKKVVVVFYGSPERDRPKLEIVSGNATSVRKLYGNLHAADQSESPTVTWVEEFTIDRKDPSKPFTFSLKASDSHGRTSNVWKVD